MCFAHSGTASDALHAQAEIGADAQAAFRELAPPQALGGWRSPARASLRPSQVREANACSTATPK